VFFYGILELFRQCGIFVFFYGILELFRQCGIFVFFYGILVPKSHRKIEAKRSKIDTPNTCMHDCSLSRIKQNYSSVYEKLWKEYKNNYNVVVSFLF
jgi:hypothetical protein